jgi:ribonuclease P protein component
MPRKNRLTGSEIRRLKPEKRLISSLFSLSISKATGTDPKVTTIVSKKVSAKAVVRNTVKRRMRALLASAPLPRGLTLVLTAKKPASDASYAEMKVDLAGLIERLHSGK